MSDEKAKVSEGKGKAQSPAPQTREAPVTLETLAARQWKYNELHMPGEGQNIRVLREIHTTVNGDTVTDVVLPPKGKRIITRAQFEAMPCYYVRKHGLWHLLEDITDAEKALLQKTPARRLIGYYAKVRAANNAK